MTAITQEPVAPLSIDELREILNKISLMHAETAAKQAETAASHAETAARQAKTEKDFEEMREATKKIQATTIEMQATNKEMQEMNKRMQKTVDNASRTVGKLGSRQGDMIEAIVGGGLIEQFEKKNFRFTMHSQDAKFKDKALGIHGEVDFILENGDTLMLVEVKTNLREDHLQDHLKRMEDCRLFIDANWSRKIDRILGAVATLTIDERIIKKAFDSGLYVIHVHSDNMTQLLPDPEGFIARIV